MSLYYWLEKSDSPLLPVARDATTSAANKEVKQELASMLPSRKKEWRKGGSYAHYDDQRNTCQDMRYEYRNKMAISSGAWQATG